MTLIDGELLPIPASQQVLADQVYGVPSKEERFHVWDREQEAWLKANVATRTNIVGRAGVFDWVTACAIASSRQPYGVFFVVPTDALTEIDGFAMVYGVSAQALMRHRR